MCALVERRENRVSLQPRYREAYTIGLWILLWLAT
jgi:hypothetical protein